MLGNNMKPNTCQRVPLIVTSNHAFQIKSSYSENSTRKPRYTLISERGGDEMEECGHDSLNQPLVCIKNIDSERKKVMQEQLRALAERILQLESQLQKLEEMVEKKIRNHGVIQLEGSVVAPPPG